MQIPGDKGRYIRRRPRLRVKLRLHGIWPKTITTSSKDQFLLRRGCHHLDSALLTPTVGDHCKGEHTRTSKHKQKGKLTEIREKNDIIHNINIIHNT